MDYYTTSENEYYYGDDDDRDSSDGFQDPESELQWTSDKESSAKVITKESLLAAQREDLQKAKDLLSLNEHRARTLLIHYRWDVDKVFAVFVEKGKEQLYAEAGVTMEELNDISLLQCSSEVVCDICIEEVLANGTTTMDCGHYFCNNCWTEHFIVKINEGQSRRIRCMAHKCNAICDEGKIRNLVSARDPDLAKKFDRFLLESYIEDNKRVKWCPSTPHCGNAICVEDDEYCEVECACGVQFCFSCSSDAHSPCSCLMWELWTKKCKDESETVNWITVNAKHCPKCHKPVEKKGGCNLVTCICGQHFWNCRLPCRRGHDWPMCWLCAGATGSDHTWNGIGGHSCGRYTENHVKKTARAKKNLLRYIHYHNRYKAHTDSFNAEAQLKEKIQLKTSNLEERESAFIDSSWVTNGLYRLFRSRRVLLYSYPFAYYMFGEDLFKNEMTEKEREIKQNLFEDQQQQLEANVEKLSVFLEEPFDEYAKDKVMETRMQIINLSKIADERCKKLYECIENDLLGPLQQGTHIIASYKSNGVAKASEHPEKNSAINGEETQKSFQFL